MSAGVLKQSLRDLRVGWARLLLRLRPTPAARNYYAQALYTRGQYVARVAGQRAVFHYTTPGDRFHLTETAFEHEQIAALLGLLRPDDVMYDIGGCIGTWSIFAAQKLTRGHMSIFEPEPRNHQRITENIALNGLRNARVRQIAASDGNEPIRFGVHAMAGDGRHSTVIAQDMHAEIIEVPALRLDDAPTRLGIPSPTVVKIDCEGGEWRVLRGMSRLLESAPPRLICLELHPNDLARLGVDPREVLTLIDTARYHPVRQWGRGYGTITFFERT